MKLEIIGYVLPLLVLAMPFAFVHDQTTARKQPELAKQAECEQALASEERVITVATVDAHMTRAEIQAFCRS